MPVTEGDLIQLSWRGSIFGQRVLLVRNYRVTGNGASAQPTGQTLGQIIDYIQPGGGWGGTEAYLGCLSNQYTLHTIRAQVVRPVRSAFAEREYDEAIGTGGPGPLSNTTGSITFRTANAGRSQVSTVKIGPLPTSGAVSGVLSTATRVALNSLADFIGSPFNVNPPGITLSAIIWHAPGLTYDAITNRTLQEQARVMVRRTVGRGE